MTVLLVACGDDKKPAAAPAGAGGTASSAPPSTVPYKVTIDPAKFATSTQITNTFFPLKDRKSVV